MTAPTAFAEPVHVARPIAPSLDSYSALLSRTWATRQFTNGGPLQQQLEAALRTHLGAPQLSLVGNGTLALMLAFRALRLTGEVITTPFTFAATAHALTWCGLTPVFADIDDETLTLDPARVKAAVRKEITAVLGVHVYGMPCDVRQVAADYGLREIYDAAHAFGTEVNGSPVASYGDATAFSFHATKLFHTGEGGALAVKREAVKARVDRLRNFGIRDDGIDLPGINAKMNELQAALGLLNLELVENERADRGVVAQVYRDRLAHVPGVRCFTLPDNVRDSRQYFVIRVDAPMRDKIIAGLRSFNVFARRYFHPLCSEFPHYRNLPSAAPENLPVAHRVSREVICLPYYGELGADGANRICDIIEHVC